ncbi:MAG: hypothetical protein QF918_07890 [Pirellulaceae bacterium]|nr:hypothetical protein [Pirellulaceae bacterium]MDP6558353.1 hypothetical protein [Pirellulaceae bacterium]MDP6717500.1 hypothetical protein [Pirellulaceae bacterium]
MIMLIAHEGVRCLHLHMITGKKDVQLATRALGQSVGRNPRTL